MSLGPRLINATMNTKFGKWLMGPYSALTPITAATISCVSKDGLNCAIYTWQAATNKRIPEDKRGFVAGLDLSNGIFNVLFQLTIALAMKPLTDKIYDKFIGNKLMETIPDKIFNKYKGTTEPLTKAASKQCAKDLIKLGKNGFGLIITLTTLQVFVKRVLVPSFATPLAAKLRSNFDKKRNKNKKQAQNNTGDIVSFENRKSDVAENTTKNKNVPDCFKSFIK